MQAAGSRRTTLVVGSIGVVLLAAALVVKLTGTSSTNVPLGIAGATFGQDVETVRRAVAGLTPIGEGPLRLRGRASVFGEPATCTYQFARSSQLERVDCNLDPRPAPDTKRVRTKLLAILRRLYGSESEQRDDHHVWANARARLMLAAGPEGVFVSNWIEP